MSRSRDNNVNSRPQSDRRDEKRSVEEDSEVLYQQWHRFYYKDEPNRVNPQIDNQLTIARLLHSFHDQKKIEEAAPSFQARSTLNPQALPFDPIAKNAAGVERNVSPPPAPVQLSMETDEIRVAANETVFLNTRDEAVLNNIGCGATLFVQEMQKITINGAIEENVTIVHEGLVELFINGSVHRTTQFGSSTLTRRQGAIHFARRPPETVIDALQKNYKGDVFIAGNLLPVRDEKEEEQIRLPNEAKAISERPVNVLETKDEKEKPKDSICELYIQWVENNILNRIINEEHRHSDEFHQEQEGCHLSVRKHNLFRLLRRDIIDILQNNSSINLIRDLILQKLEDASQDRNQDVSIRRQNISINQSKNRTYDFCKFLIGILLSAPTLFTVWRHQWYRDTFWNTRSKRAVDSLVNLVAKPPELKWK